MPVDLEAAKAALAAPHVIDLRDDGWTIKHPLSCRPHLFECAVNLAAGQALVEPPSFRGRYQCEVADDGMFTIGDIADRRLDDIDVAALVAELEATRAEADRIVAAADEVIAAAARVDLPRLRAALPAYKRARSGGR
jgi:hypothetical protein